MILVRSMSSICASLDLECGPLGSEYDDQVGYALIVVRIVLEDEAARKAFLDPGYKSALVVTFEHGGLSSNQELYPRLALAPHVSVLVSCLSLLCGVEVA